MYIYINTYENQALLQAPAPAHLPLHCGPEDLNLNFRVKSLSLRFYIRLLHIYLYIQLRFK